jgi:hypothetical protein
VAALRGQTWAAERVFDSDNTPLSQALMLNAAAKPYIVVYTDSDNRVNVSGTDLYSGTRELNLCLEVGVASKIQGKTGDEKVEIPLTDEGMEMALDMVEDQAIGVLFSDPQNDWAELLKRFVDNIIRAPGQRGASSERDRRWAARQLSIICNVQADIAPGVAMAPSHPIAQFIEVAKQHPEAGVDDIARICEALMTRRVAPEWEQIQAMIGVRRAGLRAIGLAPLSSELPTIATMYGDDLTDKRGEAPILRELTPDDLDLIQEGVGLLKQEAMRTNVVTSVPREKTDRVKIDGGATRKNSR